MGRSATVPRVRRLAAVGLDLTAIVVALVALTARRRPRIALLQAN